MPIASDRDNFVFKILEKRLPFAVTNLCDTEQVTTSWQKILSKAFYDLFCCGFAYLERGIIEKDQKVDHQCTFSK